MSVLFDPEELRELEHRLAGRLEAIAPPVRPVVADRVRAVIANTAQRSRLRAWAIAHRPEMALRPAALGAAVVVLAVATGIGVGRSVLTTASHSPSVSASAPASTPPSSPGPTAEPLADIYQNWGRIELPQGTSQAHGSPHDVVEFKGSLVIVGGAETGKCAGAPCIPETTAAVWRRTDGVWQRMPQQPSFDAGAMNSLAASSNHLLVLGATTTSPKGTGEGLLWPELWVSEDGENYRAYDAPAQFTAIVAADSEFAEFLASATTTAGTGSEIWRSTDGRNWDRVVAGGALSSAVIQKLRRVGPLFIAMGATFTPAAEGIPALWISAGGQAWTQSDVSWETSVADVDGSASRLVAVGSRVSGGSAWTSDDGGITWREFPDTDATLDRRPLGAVMSVPGGFVSLGNPYQGGASIWTSLDGKRWDAVPTQASIGSDDLLGSMTLTTAGDVVVIGMHDPGGARTASVWTSSSQPAGTGAPSLPVSSDYRTWQRVEIPDPSPHVFAGEWPYAIAAFRGQLIAVGGINGGCCTGSFTTDTRAVIWQSTDGRSWELVPHSAALALGHMTALASNGQLLVAVGSIATESKAYPGDAEQVGATWTTSDGATWTRHAGMPVFAGVAWFEGRFYAIDQDAANARSSVWASSDGVLWSLVWRFSGDYPTALRSTPLGLVAVGSTAATDGNGGPTWFSKHGASWRRYTAPASGDTIIRDVAGSASVLVGVGEQTKPVATEGESTFWVGYGQWSTAAVLSGGAPHLERVMWTGKQFVVLGEGPTGLRAFTSADGVRWSRVASPSESSGVGGTITDAMVLSDGRILIIGVGEGEDPGHHGVPRAWILSP